MIEISASIIGVGKMQHFTTGTVTAKAAFLTNSDVLVMKWVSDGHRAFAGGQHQHRECQLCGLRPILGVVGWTQGNEGLTMSWLGCGHCTAERQSSQGRGDTGRGWGTRVGLSFQWYRSMSIFYKRYSCANTLLLEQQYPIKIQCKPHI